MYGDPLAHRYLDLLKKSLLNELYIENETRLIQVMSFLLNNDGKFSYEDAYSVDRSALDFVRKTKSDGTTIVLRKNNGDGSATAVPELRNFTELSHSMIGLKRMDNIQYCMENVLQRHQRRLPGGRRLRAVRRSSCAACWRLRCPRPPRLSPIRSAASAPSHPADEGFDLSERSIRSSPFQNARLPSFRALRPAGPSGEIFGRLVKDTLADALHRNARRAEARRRLYESTMDT